MANRFLNQTQMAKFTDSIFSTVLLIKHLIINCCNYKYVKINLKVAKYILKC